MNKGVDLPNRFDLHNHCAFAIDDGASNPEETLQICQKLTELGFRGAVATVHLGHPNFPENTPDKILKRVEETALFLKNSGLDFQLLPGAEHYYRPDLFELNLYLPLTGKGHYLLVEFPTQTPSRVFKEAIFEIYSRGFRGILAHPERYQAFQRDPLFAEEAVEAGWFLQLDLESLWVPPLPFFSHRRQKTAKELLQRGLYHFAATDIHSPKQDTKKLLSILEKLVERDALRDLLETNPSKVLRGEEL